MSTRYIGDISTDISPPFMKTSNKSNANNNIPTKHTGDITNNEVTHDTFRSSQIKDVTATYFTMRCYNLNIFRLNNKIVKKIHIMRLGNLKHCLKCRRYYFLAGNGDMHVLIW